jgi:phenylacetate-CoA ligase
MFIFRGVNIYPGQIDSLLSQIQGLGSEFQVILEHGNDGRDYMTLKVERAENIHESAGKSLCEAISRNIKHNLMVSCGVEMLEYGTLPRTERKTKRVFDNRTF